jgi:hypothetical protein
MEESPDLQTDQIEENDRNTEYFEEQKMNRPGGGEKLCSDFACVRAHG